MWVKCNALPPMNALRSFEVAGRRLSFRAASEELGVTQGAVAQQVRLLEDHLGQVLFTRLARGVSLTGRGAAYHTEVSRAFDILREATGQLNDVDGSVTISVTPTFATKLLIPRLSSLNAMLPGVGIRTSRLSRLRTLNGIRSISLCGKLDLPFRPSWRRDCCSVRI